MNYFDNPLRVKIEQRGGYAGQFCLSYLEDKEYTNYFSATVKALRPIAVDFSTGERYYDHKSDAYKTILNGLPEEGCYGSEVALEIEGTIFIFYLCSSGLRTMIPRLLKAIDRKVMFMTEKIEARHHTWYGIETWVDLNSVEKFYEPIEYEDE